MEDVLGGSLRHLASAPPTPTDSITKSGRPTTPMREQRHPRNPGAKAHQSTRQVDLDSLATPQETENKAEADVTQRRRDPGPPNDAEADFITGIPLMFLMVGLMLAVFLISIDRTIISTVREGRAREFFPLLCADLYSLNPTRPSRTSRASFSRRLTLAGMARHICSLRAPSSLCSVASSYCSQSKSHTCSPCSFSSSGRFSAVLPRTR